MADSGVIDRIVHFFVINEGNYHFFIQIRTNESSGLYI